MPMGIERKLADGRGRDFCELPKETNSNSKSRKNRRRQKRIHPVMKLYDTCKEVFASAATGIIPPPEDIERLKSVIDTIKPEDVSIGPELSCFREQKMNTSQRKPRITYLHIYECEKFSMGIFCLPPSGVIPLHNHPGMTVFSKLLFGTMHIKSYDWVVDLPADTPTVVKVPENTETRTSEARLAKLKVDADFTAPCNSSILYPADGGNMHVFTAVSACAVLDVLGPPYSDPEGRHCTYYLEHPFANFDVEGLSIPEEERNGYAWLQEREKPGDLDVYGRMYYGPKIAKKNKV